MEITHSYKGLSLAYSKARKGTPEFASFMISHAGLDRNHIGLPLTIVELGVGSGQQTEFVEKQLNAIGISKYKIIAYDKSSDQLDLLKDRIKRSEISKKVKSRKLDFDNTLLPLEENSIDFTYMAWVLHHLYNQQDVFNEIARITRKGGRLFMYQVTIEDLEKHPLNEFFPTKIEYDRKRYPTLHQLKQLFFIAGFTFEKPYVIKKDNPRFINRNFLEIVTNTTLDSALTMIKDNDPTAFKEGVRRVELEVEYAECSGKYRSYNHVDRSIFWGIKK
jgi:ubiquinone/menaquinone biosynthesis C-methylase UbiE